MQYAVIILTIRIDTFQMKHLTSTFVYRMCIRTKPTLLRNNGSTKVFHHHIKSIWIVSKGLEESLVIRRAAHHLLAQIEPVLLTLCL